jgi:hypothetical protein
MPDLGINVMDYIGKKPKAVNEERLAQVARINTLANAMNLLSQGIFGAKGATITPMKDSVTPYILNQFNRQRELDLAQEQSDRQLMIRQLLRDQEIADQRAYNDQKTQENREYQDRKTKESREFQEQENAKYRLTPEEQLSIYGLKRERDLEYQTQLDKSRKELDQKYPSGTSDLKPRFYVNNNPLTDAEKLSLGAIAREFAKKPEIKQRLQAKNPLYVTNLTLNNDKLTDQQLQDIYTIMWPELEPYYQKLIEASRGKQEAKTSSQSQAKPKIDW